MWDSFKPEENRWYRWRLNGAEAYLKKNGELWQTAFSTVSFQERTSDFGGPEIELPPESLPVTCSWGIGTQVSLHPYLSPKPYLLTVREKVRIAPGMEACFVAALPPLLKFELSFEIPLTEAMPFNLSQTWFGSDTMVGEFGHSLPGSLLPNRAEQEEEPSALIRCEIYIKNKSKTMFELADFAVYPEPFNIYIYRDRLVSDTLELEFFGTDQKTTIHEVSGGNYRLLSAGIKTNVGQTLARRSVDIIKHITRFY